MAIVPWKPFWDIDRWFEEEWPERLFPRIPAFSAPKMDIYEDNGNIVAEVELPGVESKNIEIEVKDNILEVEAKVDEKKEEKKKGYYKKEISRGFYKRAVPLPVEVQGEKAEASFDEGVLKVIIPKSKPQKGKKSVKIKVKGRKTA